MKQPFKHVAIIGLGLIGGSIARDIRQKGLAEKVSGYGRNPERMEKAYSLGLIDEYHVGFTNGLQAADLVVIGTPVRTIVQIAQEVFPLLRAGTVITDVGSVKGEIVAGIPANQKRD